MKKHIVTILRGLFNLIGAILFVLLKAIIKTLLWLARNVWKPYLRIETPLYKMWWANHRRLMQKKLDNAREKRLELGETF